MITLYDTACSSKNLGDEIIMDAVVRELGCIFPDRMLIRYPTHEPLRGSTKKHAWSNDMSFVGGSNLLRNYWRNRARKNQWSLSLLDAWRMTPAILMGVGWNAYADEPEFKAKLFYGSALSKEWVHATRDSYTVEKLKQCGINNAINTGCPTLWSLDERILSEVPLKLSGEVVFTLTDYRKDAEWDLALIEQLLKIYKVVYFWPQGSEDNEYLLSLSKAIPGLYGRLNILPVNVNAYNNLLRYRDVDYVGTRLHAGIRAMQLGRKCVIVGVDNRATEMGRDFCLPLIDREGVSDLFHLVNERTNKDVVIPSDAIQEWKGQFVS